MAAKIDGMYDKNIHFLLFLTSAKAWRSLLTAANKEGLIDVIKDLVDIPPESVVANYPQPQ